MLEDPTLTFEAKQAVMARRIEEEDYMLLT